MTRRREEASNAEGQLPEGRRRRVQHLLSRGGIEGRAGDPAAARFPERQSYVPRPHPDSSRIGFTSSRPIFPGSASPTCRIAATFTYTFDNIARVIDRFTEVVGLDRFAIYVFDYGAPTGFRLATWHPERVTAIISQNGNAYEEGLSDGWKPIRAYWEDPSQANRDALRAFLAPETTVWQYTHGVPDATAVSPDGYSLDNFYLARPGADEVQLDLFGDYKSNVALYPAFQDVFPHPQAAAS